jgi:hypothetical protein
VDLVLQGGTRTVELHLVLEQQDKHIRSSWRLLLLLLHAHWDLVSASACRMKGMQQALIRAGSYGMLSVLDMQAAACTVLCHAVLCWPCTLQAVLCCAGHPGMPAGGRAVLCLLCCVVLAILAIQAAGNVLRCVVVATPAAGQIPL